MLNDLIKKYRDGKLIITPRQDRATLMTCIGIALIFWFFVKLSQQYETEITVTVTYQLPDSQAFVNLPPDEITATLTGSGWDLFYEFIFNRSPSIDFIAEQFPSGMIEPTQITNRIKREIASEVKVTDTDEEFIILEFQNQFVKTLPIRLEHNIEFVSGYDLKNPIQIYPDSVTVTGPISLVRDLEFWSTDLFESKDLKVDLQEELNMKMPEQGEIRLNPPKTVLTVEVEEFTEKEVYVPVEIKNATDSIRLSSKTVRVNFEVGLSRFDSITKKDFHFEADFKNVSLNDENNVIPVNPRTFPEGIKHPNYFPKSVEFFIVQKGAEALNPDSLKLVN